MKKEVLILIGVALVIVALGLYIFLNWGEGFGRRSAGDTQTEGAVEIANPASSNCIDRGGTLEMREGEGGTYGVCVFVDGSECEEWALLREECVPGGGN
jgi:putative hemolysin